MGNTIAVVIIILLVVGGWYYVSTKNSDGTPAAQTPVPTVVPETVAPSASATTSASSPSTAATVHIQNFSFNPSILAIKTGTIVTWTNDDSVPHTVTSDSGDVLNSQTLAPGQSFSHAFTASRTFPYHCAIHSMMKGTVSVSN